MISTIGTKAGFSVITCTSFAEYMLKIDQAGDAALKTTVKAIVQHMREEDAGKYHSIAMQMKNELDSSYYAKCFQDINELFQID